MEQLLHQILTKLDKMESTMATKDELSEIRQTMVTKDELSEIRQTMVTKDELSEIRQTMVTKDELSEIRQTMAKGFEDVHKKLNAISEQVAYNTEQISKINQLDMEVRIIKKAIANL